MPLDYTSKPAADVGAPGSDAWWAWAIAAEIREHREEMTAASFRSVFA